MVMAYSEADSQNEITANVIMATCNICIIIICIAYVVGAVRSGADNKPTAERIIADQFCNTSATIRQAQKDKTDAISEYATTEGKTTLLKVSTMTCSHPAVWMMGLLAEILRKGGWCGEYQDIKGKFKLQRDLEVDPA